MNQYLLTYLHGGRLVAEVVDAQGIANIVGRSAVTGARNFRAYRITLAGVYPVQLTGNIAAVTVRLLDPNGNPVESASYCNW